MVRVPTGITSSVERKLFRKVVTKDSVGSLLWSSSDIWREKKYNIYYVIDPDSTSTGRDSKQ